MMHSQAFSATQARCLDLFLNGEFKDLILFFRDFPANFPKKQYPVVSWGNYGTPGEFGCRASNTILAIPDPEHNSSMDHYVTFTIGVRGELTLNLHASQVTAVDWVNGSSSVQWVYKHALSQKEADELAVWAECVGKS